jgi:hypothetical protein
MKRGPNRSLIILATLLAATISQTTALEAHPMIPGVTGYPALMLHSLLLIHHALAMATAALLIGQSPGLSRWRTLIAFAACLALGALVQGAIPNLFKYYWIAATALTASAAAMAALFFPVPPRLALPAIAVLGILIGLDTHGEAPGLWSQAMSVSAAIVTASILLLLAGFIGFYHLPRPLRLLARIMAAWIAAATIMILAFAFRG